MRIFFDENRQDDKQMKTYNTYQEAKIDNPECEIYLIMKHGLFANCTHHKSDVVRFVEFDSDGIKCNPADYCMTVEEFLMAGHKLVSGDIIIHRDEGFFIMPDSFGIHWNDIVPDEDSESYILRAAALEKPKRTKVEFVKVVGENFFGLESDLLAGNLYCGEGEEWRIIDIPSLADEWANNNLYRRIETEIDERQEFIEECQRYGSWEEMYDSGKFKLVN